MVSTNLNCILFFNELLASFTGLFCRLDFPQQLRIVCSSKPELQIGLFFYFLLHVYLFIYFYFLKYFVKNEP